MTDKNQQTAPKVISERNLDGKTIRKSEDGTAVEVAISKSEDNLIEVTAEGIKVSKPQTIALESLGGVKIGDVIVEQ